MKNKKKTDYVHPPPRCNLSHSAVDELHFKIIFSIFPFHLDTISSDCAMYFKSKFVVINLFHFHQVLVLFPLPKWLTTDTDIVQIPG